MRKAITGEKIGRDSVSVNKLSKYFRITLLTLKGALHKKVREFPAQGAAVANEKITRIKCLGAIIYDFLAHITQIGGYFTPQHRRISNSEGSSQS